MAMTNNIVITGPPSSGKSTIIKELSVHGYNTVPETAALNIDRVEIKLNEDESIEDVVDTLNFQKSVTNKRLIAESLNGVHTNSTTILDRSLIDNIAYRRYFGVPVGQKLKQVVQDRYDKVLFFEPLSFEQSGATYEDSEIEQENLKHALRSTYEHYESAYDEIHSIPETGIEPRLEMVIDHIEDKV